MLLLPLMLGALCAGAFPAGIFIKSIRLDNVKLEDFADFLRKKLRVNVALRDSREELEKLPDISLDFKNVPLWVVVKYASREAGVKYQFRKEMLYIGKNVQIVKPYYAAEHKHINSVLDKYPDGTRMYMGRYSYFPVGYTAPKTVVSGNTVITTSAQPIFKKFYSGFWYDAQPSEPEEVTIAKNQAKRHPYKIPRDFPLTKAKLFEIKMSVDFKEKPLREALTRLRQLSIRHDPDKQGVNFYLPKSVDADKLLIDMALKKTSLYRIIKYLCQATGLTFRVAPFVVEINKKTEK